MTPERAIEILKADTWILTRDQSHAMAQALESALKAERERAERAVAKLAEADQDSSSAGKLLNQIDIPYGEQGNG